MRATTPPQAFELPDELKDDSWLLWLRDHAHEDLWMPRVPLAVIERIRRRFTGQKRTTLLNVWIGIRRLLLSMSLIKGNMLGVREIADWSGVSRSRLCGDKGYIQDLLDIGVIGVTVVDDEPLLKDRYRGRTLYHIDMRALEVESLVLLREQFSEKKKAHVPRRNPTAHQGDILDLIPPEPPVASAEGRAARHTPAAPLASPAAPGSGAVPLPPCPDVTPPGTTTVCDDAAVVSIGATVTAGPGGAMAPMGATMVPHAPCTVPVGATFVPGGTTPVSHGAAHSALSGGAGAGSAPVSPAVVPLPAVGMDGIGMDGKGGEGENRPLSQVETIQIVHTAIQQALAPAIQQALTRLSETQQISVPGASRGPTAPEGEPSVEMWPKELWSLYKKGECDPVELGRLALLPELFDAPSGGYGAYWVTRAILMLSERPTPVTVSYLKGVLERMRRSGEWSTAQLDAPAEEHEGAVAQGRERGRTAAVAVPPPPRAVASASAVPTGATEASVPAAIGQTALTVFAQYAGNTRLLPEQERQITERVRDLEIWAVVCANWRENKWKFDSVDKMLHRYVTLESEHAKDRPAISDGLTKLEREIHAISGLSDEEKAKHCQAMMQHGSEGRRRYVEDLRRRVAAGTREGARS